MSEKLGVGIIGFGQWAIAAHAPILREMPGVEVVAVAARTDKTLNTARELISPSLATYYNYHDLLADPRVKAVVICPPNRLHAEVLAWALKADKHILMEPPFGTSPEEVFPLMDQIEARTHRVFQGDFELGYLPVVETVRGLVCDGRVGETLSATVSLWCNWGYGGGPWSAESTQIGAFLWTGPWYFHVLDVLTGRAPQSVSATGVRAMNGELIDHGWASMDYGGNLIGRFEFSLVALEGQEIEVRVVGTRGEIRADLMTGRYAWRSADSLGWRGGLAPAATPAPGFVGMRECLGSFVRAVKEGQPVLAEVASCRRVHQAAFAAQQAADSGETMVLKALTMPAKSESSE